MTTWTSIHMYLYHIHTNEHYINTDIHPKAAKGIHGHIHIVKPSVHTVNVYLHILKHIIKYINHAKIHNKQSS